ncbi:tetratricopeptide repeat protein [Aeoliella mucimassa]|uniref:tetratricopeptide repeat protein n=1 Tax=Aeoliella mucimassa TaxID=2527972 RepID=UPI0018D30226|nr:tetratricopeptide repeat protein [Aeoliella mucimassa]
MPKHFALATSLALAISGSLAQAQTSGVVYVDDLAAQSQRAAANGYQSNMPMPLRASNQVIPSNYPRPSVQQLPPLEMPRTNAMPEREEPPTLFGKLGGLFGGNKNASQEQEERLAQQQNMQRMAQLQSEQGRAGSTTANTNGIRQNNSNMQLRSNGSSNQPTSLFSLWTGDSNKNEANTPSQTSPQQVARSNSRKPSSWGNKSRSASTAVAQSVPSMPNQVAMRNAPLPLPMTTSAPQEPSYAMVTDQTPAMPKEPADVAMVSDQADLGIQLAMQDADATVTSTPEFRSPAIEPSESPEPEVKQAISQQIAEAAAKLPASSHIVQISDEVATVAPQPKPQAPVATPQPPVAKPQEIVNEHVASNHVTPRPAPIVSTQASRPRQPLVKIQAQEAAAAMHSNPVTPAPEVADQPSTKSVELLAEANKLAGAAETEEDYTAVVQACRHVLAIENAPVAVAYCHDLASWALNRRGELKTDEGRIKEALLDFNDSLRLDPKRYRAIHNRGVLAAQAGRFADAFDDFNLTIELNPEFAKAYSNRGALYVQAGELEKASADYRQAIALDPDLAVAHKGRGRVCHMLGRMELALQHLDAAARLAPEDARIVNNRGDLLYDMGRYRSAMNDYETAIQLAPAFADAHRSLAWLYATCPDRECRNPSKSVALAKRAIELSGEPDDLEYDTLAAGLAASGDYQNAVAMMDKALEMATEKDRENYTWRRQLYTKGQPYISEPAGNIQQASYVE